MTDRPSVRPSWVLLVDDDAALCRTLERALRRWGYEPMVAENGQDALDLCSSGMPAVAIVDIMMPGMDGWVVTKHLVRRGGSSPPRIIMISASFTHEEIHPEGGAVVASLPKPIDLKRLHEVVERAWTTRLRPSRLPRTSSAPGSAEASRGSSNIPSSIKPASVSVGPSALKPSKAPPGTLKPMKTPGSLKQPKSPSIKPPKS